jgi:hypothetical protein
MGALWTSRPYVLPLIVMTPFLFSKGPAVQRSPRTYITAIIHTLQPSYLTEKLSCAPRCMESCARACTHRRRLQHDAHEQPHHAWDGHLRAEGAGHRGLKT